MKWIGQHIWDYISRFRNDVYLEDVSSGTIASGGNLGLDSNNKIVKADVPADGDITSVGFTVDDGSSASITTGDVSFSILGGEGIDTSLSVTSITISGEDASTSNKGVAKFHSDNFDVSSGSVTIKSGGIDLAAEVTGTLPVGNGGTGATTLTDNALLLGNGTGAVEASSHLTYYNPDVNSDYLQIGDSSTTTAGIATANDAPLVIQVDFPIGQTNAAGGDMTFIAGASTGTATAGSFKFRSSPTTGSSGTTLNVQSEIAALDNAGNLQLDGGITTGSTSFVNSSGVVQVATQGTIDHDSLANFVAAEHYRWDTDISSTATINAANIPTLNQSTTGNADTATALTSGDKTIEGNLRIGGSGDTSDNWITIDARNGDDASGGGICFYETGTDTIGAPQYGAKIVYNEDDDELAIGTMHNNTFMRQLHMDRGTQSCRMQNAVLATTSTDGPFLMLQNDDTSVVDGQSLCRIIARNADRGTGTTTSQIQWFATEDHDSDSCGTKINFTVTPNGNSQSETVAMTIGQDSSLTVNGNIELGHASDTTISRVAAGIAAVESELVVTTYNPLLASSGSTNQTIATYQSRRTLTTAEMNDLHNTPIQIAPGGGSNVVIIPVSGMIRVDRASTNSGGGSLDFHYNGVTPSYGTTSLVHYRRFMNNVAADRVFPIVPNGSGVTVANSLTEDVNKAIEVSLTSACTTDCFTSVDIFLTYQKIKIA